VLQIGMALARPGGKVALGGESGKNGGSARPSSTETAHYAAGTSSYE
jgi:hypothetical protein